MHAVSRRVILAKDLSPTVSPLTYPGVRRVFSMAIQLKNGYTATEAEDEARERMEKFFTGQRGGLVRLEPHGWFFPKRFLKFADKIYDFEFKKGDVLVMTWPKNGTTWMQEIVWTMRHNPNLDNPKATIPILFRSPFIEFDMIAPTESVDKSVPKEFMEVFTQSCPGRDPKNGVLLQLAELHEEPRDLKTHLPFSFVNPELLEKAKTVVVVRNPKDVCVSFHHHCRIIDSHGFCGSMDDFVDFFVNDELYYSPYWPFLKECFEKKDHPNVHFAFFEDLKADPVAEVKRLDAFLETNLTDDQISRIVNYTKFEAMQDRGNKLIVQEQEGTEITGFNQEIIKKDGGFFRKGEVGSFKRKLTPEQEAKIDAWTQKKSGGLHTQLKYST